MEINIAIFLQALSQACTKTPPEKEYKRDAKKLSSDKFKVKYDENSLIIKTTYWWAFF